MPEIIMYSSNYCPFCIRAKQLLESKGLTFEEIIVDGQPQLRADMTRLAGGRTSVPQIWIGQTYVGGCDELLTLERSGQLDPLLAN